jgi:hypothetical protein
MTVQESVGGDHQLARLLQIGIVLEEVVEARATKHASEAAELDDELCVFLEDAASESATHRERLERLVGKLEAETVPFDEIERLVERQYEAEQDFDGVLYDQLCNEETAYKFYDDLIEVFAESKRELSIDRTHLLEVLRDIRSEEEEGVEEVTALMEERS